MPDLTYTQFAFDPLVDGDLAPKVALWDQGGDWVIVDFLTHRNGGIKIAQKVHAYEAKMNVVHDQRSMLPYVIIEVLAVRLVGLAIYKWASKGHRYAVLDPYEREEAAEWSRRLQLPGPTNSEPVTRPDPRA